MDGPLRLVLSISVLSLGVACFLLGTVTIIVPHWGTYRNRVRDERGSFGPWVICRDMGYGKISCGSYVSSFKPVFGVYASGVCSILGIIGLGILSFISILQLVSQCYNSNILCNHFTQAKIKLINAVIGALLSLVSVCLFATQSDDLERGFIVEWSICFYLQVILTVFCTVLLILTLLEYFIIRRLPIPNFNGYLSRKSGIQESTRSGLLGTTITNPGFHDDQRVRRTTNGISMTDSSVRFVLSKNSVPNPTTSLSRLEISRELSKRVNHRRNLSNSLSPSKKRSSFKIPKSSSTMNTTITHNRSTIESHSNNISESNNGSLRSISPTSNGSSVSSLSTLSTLASLSSNPRGPLRSSLKRSRTTDDGFGIQNPGFSGTSPTLSRTGSLKKVRIQTQSTDV